MLLPQQNHTLPDLLMSRQVNRDLLQLYPLTTKFYLMVYTAQEFDLPGGCPAGKVSGMV
ncbi:hypothetical protein D3C85_1064170 [compost metagenome]